MTTKADLRTQLRERLGETLATAWSDTELDTWIYEGVKELNNRTEYNRRELDYEVLAGEWRVPVAASVQRIHKIEWGPTSSLGYELTLPSLANWQVYRLEYMNISTLDAVRGTGQTLTSSIPQYYSLWGTSQTNNQDGSGGIGLTVILYPKPSEAGSIRLHCYAVPEEPATDNDDWNLPAGWEHLVLMYAEYRALVRDKDDRWQIAKSDFEEGITNFKRMFSTYTDETESIQHSSGWYGGVDWGYW